MIVQSNADLPHCAVGTVRHASTPAPEPFGDILAAISHEIRTPLAAVIGFCELMGREIFGPVGDPRYAAYVRHIADGGAALLKSAEDTLALSVVIADGARARRPEAVPLASLLHDVVSAVPSLGQGQQPCVQVSIEPGAMVLGDRQSLRQALLNLVIEAVQQSADGAVAVTATAANGRVRLTIKTSAASEADGGAGRSSPLGISIARTLLDVSSGRLHIAQTGQHWQADISMLTVDQPDLFGPLV